MKKLQDLVILNAAKMSHSQMKNITGGYTSGGYSGGYDGYGIDENGKLGCVGYFCTFYWVDSTTFESKSATLCNPDGTESQWRAIHLTGGSVECDWRHPYMG